MMRTAVYPRIVIMSVDPGAWCGMCHLPSPTRVAYVLEPMPDGAPNGLRTITYCEACEGA
jgi:hypothetical protein